MNWIDKLMLVVQVEALWQTMKGLAVGESAEVPLIKCKLGSKRWEIGRVPVKRVG
jgi:hypothetical protein